MIYTDSGKYAIRALTHMASHGNQDEPLSAADIAEAEDIPPYYLAKVLQDLARADLLSSVRGRGGGFLLKPLQRAGESPGAHTGRSESAPAPYSTAR